jgi:REP element-mobilizing transposase RayT
MDEASLPGWVGPSLPGWAESKAYASAQFGILGKAGYDSRKPATFRPGLQTMSSTYLSLHYHLVFATKNREPTLAPSWRVRLHEFLGGTVRGLEGVSEGVGGVADHVHLLVSLRATHCLADFMRELKKATSAWVHREIGEHGFAWQEGYSAFTVSATAIGPVQQYIANQEQHHRMKSFHEELIGLLKRAGIPFDPKYLD